MNAEVKHSMKNGTKHYVGSTLYIGENPVYTPTVNDLGMVVGHTKVTKGIPFVRVR